MSVQAMDQGLDRGLIQVTDVGRGLAGLLTQHEGLWVDEAESINDDLALDGLNRIDDNGDGARSELLKGLLRVDIDRG